MLKLLSFFSIVEVVYCAHINEQRRAEVMSSFENVSNFFRNLLPILAVVAILALIVLLIHLISVMRKVKITVTGVNEAIGTTNGYLKDFEVTVKTVNNMAMSVEAVRATAERAVKKTAKTWTREYDTVKAWVTDFLENKLPRKNKAEKATVQVEEVPAEEKKETEETNNG